MSLQVTTTAREPFTEEDSRELARLILRRFGYELEAAAKAWRRMLGNSCDDYQFLDLVGRAHYFEERRRVGLEEFSP